MELNSKLPPTQVTYVQLNEDNLSKFIESKQFLSDSYIRPLLEKGIALGFTFDNIKETFKTFLNPSNLDLSKKDIDYSSLINEEVFIERLILLSVQNNQSKNPGNSGYENDDDENDDDPSERLNANFLNSEDFDENKNDINDSDYYNNQQMADSFQNKLILDSKKQIKSNVANPAQKKAVAYQKIHQEHQEFLSQSMNRINDKSNLRPIIVDSNDVGSSSHLNKQVFNFSRVKQVVDFFEKRQHKIYVILSQWRKEQIMGINNMVSGGQSSQSTNATVNAERQALLEMEQKDQVQYTPSKKVGGKRIVCDDDSCMLKLACNNKGIIVSNDNFKRFLNHNEDFKLVIEERVLMYSFIGDTFMPAEDPLGKGGPSLDNFLRFESFSNQQYLQRCPYKKKCTYGSKCKYWHPERTQPQGGQVFKTAFQNVMEDSQHEKMRVEIILSSQTGENIIFTENRKLTQSPNFSKESKLPPNFPLMYNTTSDESNNDELNKINLTRKFINKNSIIKPQSFIDEQSSDLRSMGHNQNINFQHKFKPQNVANIIESNWLNNKNANFDDFSLADSKSDNNLSQHASKFGSLIQNNTNLKNSIKFQNSSRENENSIRAQLSAVLSQEQVNNVLKQYPNETDLEKLIFLAGSLSFDM
jgi:hypothetical protein